MAVAPGTRLGPYAVISMLGAGGMGEVYRARDSRLDRSVAIKIRQPSRVRRQRPTVHACYGPTRVNPIPGTEGRVAAARSPFFSADGKQIGFWQGGLLKKVPTSGGAPVPLCKAITPFGASWTTDNTILFGQGEGGIWCVSGNGGKPENVVQVEKGEFAHGPQLLPGGRDVLFTLARDRNGWDAAQIVVQSLDTDIRHVIVEGGDARYVPTGHLVYARGNTLLAVPFDLATLKMTGGPVSLVEDVARAPQDPIALTGAAHFATSSQEPGGVALILIKS
jgi:hypothetical protein